MTRIVGHKIERYLTAEWHDYGGHCVVTHHQVITELHATKGWRPAGHECRQHSVKRLPPVDQWRNADVTVFVRAEGESAGMPKWSRPDFFAGRDQARINAMMRHRERRRDIQIAENIARNKLEDQRLAGLR